MKHLCLLIAILLLCMGTAGAEREDTVTMVAINVRKADCLLLFAGDDVYMVDTGTAESWGAVSAALCHYGVDRLTGVIVTHTDKDHIGGLAALASSSIRVDGWYASKYFTDVKESKHLVVIAAQIRGDKVHWLSAGDALPLGNGVLRVLGPMSESDTENCNSLVMLAENGGSILLAGDMEFPEESELLEAGLIPHCDVLKVGNHGEADATSEQLVRAVSPTLAVISTNTSDEPDTPAPRVMNLLRKYAVQTVLTQDAGDGVLVTASGDGAYAQKLTWEDRPAPLDGLCITAKDVKGQSISVTNKTQAEMDISDCFIFSERGGEIFVFPKGTVLRSGQTVIVTSRGSKTPGDFVWPEKSVWAKNKPDAAILYDAWGNELDRKD